MIQKSNYIPTDFKLNGFIKFFFHVSYSVQKAYHRLSLQVHPDRVTDSKKEEATEKFKVLTKIKNVLSDLNKKATYDEQGIIDDSNEIDSDWSKNWLEVIKQFGHSENENFNEGYVGSESEKSDIRKAYLDGKGCLNFVLKSVPFMTVEDEPRIIEIVRGLY